MIENAEPMLFWKNVKIKSLIGVIDETTWDTKILINSQINENENVE